MKKQPLISIITPTYNADRFIRLTIESVLSQNYHHWEMIIVDDCSSDNTVNVIEAYVKKDPRIKLNILRVNAGAAAARNKALDNAKGDYIAFLDADDLWLPEKLSKQVAFCQKNNALFCFSGYRKITEKGVEYGDVVDGYGLDSIDYWGLLKKKVVLGCLTVMVRSDVIGSMRMKPLRTGQDFVFWLDILRGGIVAHNMKDCVALYRITSGSISRNKFKRARQQWYIYRHVENFSKVSASWYFINYLIRSILRK